MIPVTLRFATCIPFIRYIHPNPCRMRWPKGAEPPRSVVAIVKNMLAGTMLEAMRPMMEKRSEIVKKPKEVEEIIADGTQRAHKVAASTLDRVKQAMKLK